MKKFLRERKILSGGGIAVGLSGGADSVCLLLILRELAAEAGFPLYAIHVHHGIRKEGAERDSEFCRALCKRLGVAFSEYRVDVPKEAREQGIGEEEAGRAARYRIFGEAAEQLHADAVAVAHHKDDNAETILFRLCRGTGIRGLCGIPAVSNPFPDPSIRLIRPLLPFTREEILAELRRREEIFCTDETNDETVYARNRIRMEIMPLLKTVNSEAPEHVAALSEHAEMIMELLQKETEKAYSEAVSEGFLYAERLKAYPRIVRREVLLKFAKELAGAEKDFTEQHAEAMEQLLRGPVSKELSLPYRLTLERTYEGIRRKAENAPDTAETELLPGDYELTDGEVLSVSVKNYSPGEPVPKKKWIKWFDYDMIKCVPVLRTRREGDRFRISPDGGTKLLREYFVTAKIPREERDRIKIVAAGSEVLWIPGARGTEQYYVTGSTRRILVLEIKKETRKGQQDGKRQCIDSRG